ncbi:hypothetical protein BDF21DRAFT_396229 [Thamnidium elegans]|nr:hypothetical protein BDF21DRAFT_396229 [Thamnidium elegans]
MYFFHVLITLLDKKITYVYNYNVKVTKRRGIANVETSILVCSSQVPLIRVLREKEKMRFPLTKEVEKSRNMSYPLIYALKLYIKWKIYFQVGAGRAVIETMLLIDKASTSLAIFLKSKPHAIRNIGNAVVILNIAQSKESYDSLHMTIRAHILLAFTTK